jgi:hypothetical protein
MTKQQKLYIAEFVSNGGNAKKAAIAAGYSLRGGATVSALKKHAGIQAAIEAIQDRKLQSAPTIESYHSLLNSAAAAALRGDPNAWILLQCAQAHGKEVLGQEPKAEQSPRAVLVKFVESQLPPEQVQAVNKFVGECEAKAGLPQGWTGRLMPEPQVIQAQSQPLKPVPQAKPEGEGAVLLLPISEAERRRLERVCMPVGGALRTHHCRTHGTYECIWQQSASGEWGWSDCPACWQKVN